MKHDLDVHKIEALVRDAQKGREEAFGHLFDLVSPHIERYISHRVPTEEVEDIHSDIWLKVVQKLHTYAPKGQAGFRAWIFRIAHNAVVDFYRRQKPFLSLENESGEGDESEYILQIEDEQILTPDDHTNLRLDTDRMLRELKNLSALQREILELRYLEGFLTHEIAQITGKSEGNIRVTQLRALRELKRRLSADDPQARG